MRVLLWSVLALGLVALLAALAATSRETPLPPSLEGVVVYVSNRDGVDALYERRLPHGEDRRLTFQSEPVRDPAVSPDGLKVAFSMGGRIGLVSRGSGDVSFLSLGVDWVDTSPSWRPDGEALVVAARRAGAPNADIHFLAASIDALIGQAERKPLTVTPGLDESLPIFGPDASFIIFIREENLFRMGLTDGRTRRITSGFHRVRAARFLPSGRLLALWTEGKTYGIDAMDSDGKNRETLSEGSTYYRTIAPSPDGRFLLATYTFDLGFHALDALKLRQTEEVRLLDLQGRSLARLVHSWRDQNHSPAWTR
jgi:Tol biopolymer transport system component